MLEHPWQWCGLDLEMKPDNAQSWHCLEPIGNQEEIMSSFCSLLSTFLVPTWYVGQVALRWKWYYGLPSWVRGLFPSSSERPNRSSGIVILCCINASTAPSPKFSSTQSGTTAFRWWRRNHLRRAKSVVLRMHQKDTSNVSLAGSEEWVYHILGSAHLK